MHPIIFSKNKTIVTVFTTFGQSSKCSRSSFRSIYQFEFSTLWNRISAWIFFFTHLHTCETSIWWIFIPIFYKLCTAFNITRFLLRSLSLINVNEILTSSLTSTINYTVFENHRKSHIQQYERSNLWLHFEWTKVH